MRKGFQHIGLALGGTAFALVASSASGQQVSATPPGVVAIQPVEPAQLLQVYLTGQTWETAPRPDFPERAQAAGLDAGAVDLDCRVASDGALTNCRIMRESPQGAGFGPAALRAIAQGRLAIPAPTSNFEQRVRTSVYFRTGEAETQVVLQAQERVEFTRPAGAAGSPSPVDLVPLPRDPRVVSVGPPRISRPGNATPVPPLVERRNDPASPRWSRPVMAEYPRAARGSGVDGRVALDCVMTTNGLLEDCRVVSETPPGLGFAEAALAATSRGRIEPRVVDGVAQGARVRFTVRMSQPED